MALQIRRGTDAERGGITPLAGELVFTTDTKKLFVGDGSTVGGVQVDTTQTGSMPTQKSSTSVTPVEAEADDEPVIIRRKRA